MLAAGPKSVAVYHPCRAMSAERPRLLPAKLLHRPSISANDSMRCMCALYHDSAPSRITVGVRGMQLACAWAGQTSKFRARRRALFLGHEDT